MNDIRRRITGAATVFVLLAVAQGFGQAGESAFAETTIHKRVNEVNLTFTVTDGKGRFITGLTQDNFSILDDQHPPASVHSFHSLTELPLRICIAFDASDSITNYLKFQQEVAIGFLKRILRPGVDEACLIKFTDKPVLVEGFTSDVAKLESSVRRVHVQGATAVWDAVRFASETLGDGQKDSDMRRVLVLITDGQDNSSKISFDDALESILRAGIAAEVVDTIPPMTVTQIGPPESRQNLKRLATSTGGTMWSGGRPKDLANSLAKIEQSLRSQYFVAYRPSGELQPGKFRRIEMKVRGRKGKLAYRTGYYVPPAD